MTNIKQGIAGAAVAVLLSGFAAPAAAEDCRAGELYFKRAGEALENYDDEARFRNLQAAVDTCSDARYWLALGDAIMQLQSGAEYYIDPDLLVLNEEELAIADGEPDYSHYASKAYDQANVHAADAATKAEALRKWSEVVFYEGNDPQRAYLGISAAERLVPGDAEVAELSSAIYARIENPEEGDLVRGLRRTLYADFTPTSLPSDVQGEPAEFASTGGSGSANAAAPAVSRAELAKPVYKGTINQNIVFRTGSTQVEDRSFADLRRLADSLASDQLASERFLIVGHADARGDATANMMLSIERARAIERTLVMLQPSLDGRIDTEGRGEQDLLLPGATDDTEHRRNRRIEVRVR